MASRLCARLATMATVLAQQKHPSPQELFATVEEMISMGGTVDGTTGFLMYDDIDAAHQDIVQVFGLTAGQVWQSDDGLTEFAEVPTARATVASRAISVQLSTVTGGQLRALPVTRVAW